MCREAASKLNINQTEKKVRTQVMQTNETGAVRQVASGALKATWANKSTFAGLALVLGCSLTALAADGNDNRAPEVPDTIVVDQGNKVDFHALGIGVQIYTWDGSAWTGPVPEATLFHANGVVATHFAGPTWQSNSGSTVVGTPEKSVTVDTNAIPWVRLKAKSSEGPGIFANTTFIQRVHTVGGKAPKENGSFVGQVARVPYAADYFFYRATDSN